MDMKLSEKLLREFVNSDKKYWKMALTKKMGEIEKMSYEDLKESLSDYGERGGIDFWGENYLEWLEEKINKDLKEK